MKRVMLGILVALAACSSDRPNCVEAIEHENAAGCAAYQETNPASFCEIYAADVYRNCENEFDDWLRCVSEIEMYDCEACGKLKIRLVGCSMAHPP